MNANGPTHYARESTRIPLLFIDKPKAEHGLDVDAAVCSVDATPARDIMIEIRNQNEVAMRERVLQVRKPVSGTPSSLSRAYAFRLHANRRAKTGCARSMRSMRPNGPDIRRLLRSMLASVLRCCLRSLLIFWGIRNGFHRCVAANLRFKDTHVVLPDKWIANCATCS